MKLTLLILLLIGVVSATQDLSGSEAAQDPVRIEDATEKEAPSLRALGSRRQYRNYRCNENRECKDIDYRLKCNSNGRCVFRNKYRDTGTYNYYDGYRGVFRDIGKRCDRNRQCRGDLLRCNKNRGRCELKGNRTGKDYYYYYYGYEGLNRDIGKRCDRNRQCRGDLLRCNKNRGRCELRSCSSTKTCPSGYKCRSRICVLK